MQNKLLFSLVILLVITVQFIGSESSDRKDSKSDKDNSEVVSLITTKKKTSRVKDQNGRPSSNNYRSRPRGPSTYDEDDEWSSYGMGPSAYETGPYLGNGPTCFPLLDPQYPLFSDLCGAVPQARYALPNAFGHIERWQIAQVLGTVLGPISPAAANPVCTRSLRHLLCPLLFPPCPTKYEAPPVVPCQAFCRIVKTQCAAPGLELLPCDLLPPTSDLCPINPSPYSSLLSPFIPPPPLGGPMFPPGLPPSALSALLAQSAMASGLPPMGVFPPPVLPGAGIFPPAGIVPSPAGIAPSPAVTTAIGGPSSAVPPTGPGPALASAPSPTSVLTPTPFPSVLPGVPFSSMMSPLDPSSSGLASMFAASSMSPMFPADPSSPLSSMLAQSAFASGLSPAGFPPTGLGPMLSPAGLPPTGLGSMLSPMNPLFGPQSLLADSLTPILVDFPPLPFGAGAMSPAVPRFFPRLRSGTAEAA